MGACAKKKRGGFIVVHESAAVLTRLDRLGWKKAVDGQDARHEKVQDETSAGRLRMSTS